MGSSSFNPQTRFLEYSAEWTGGCIDHSEFLAERQRRSPNSLAGNRTRRLTSRKICTDPLSHVFKKNLTLALCSRVRDWRRIKHRAAHQTETPRRAPNIYTYRFTTYQDARRVRLVDGLIFETNILRVSPVNPSPK